MMKAIQKSLSLSKTLTNQGSSPLFFARQSMQRNFHVHAGKPTPEENPIKLYFR
jgi:hypothetical protein